MKSSKPLSISICDCLKRFDSGLRHYFFLWDFCEVNVCKNLRIFLCIPFGGKDIIQKITALHLLLRDAMPLFWSLHTFIEKWTWRESNPRPKANSHEALPLQSVFFHSLYRAPTNRITATVASSILYPAQRLTGQASCMFEARIPDYRWSRADCCKLGSVR